MRLRPEPQTARWSASAKARRERGAKFLLMTLARSSCYAFNAATPHWRDFGGLTSVISRTLSLGIAQTKRKMHETRTRTQNAGFLDAAGPFQPGRSDAPLPAELCHRSHDLGKNSRDSQWRMTIITGPADNSSSASERLRSLPDANPKGVPLRHGGFRARFAGDADRLHFKSKEPWMSMEEVRVSGTLLPSRMDASKMARFPTKHVTHTTGTRKMRR